MKKWLDILSRHEVAIVSTALTIAAILLLAQHWGMMFSNSDDPWFVRADWEEIKKSASDQGRFWLLPISFMAGLPHKLGGWVGVSATKMLVNGLTLLAFTAFLTRLINIRFALTASLTWLALLDVSQGYYSAFHGYLLMFNLQMGALFLSLWWYLKLLDEGRKGAQLAGPYLLFGFALLAYEPMLFFAAAYYAVALFRHQTADAQHLATASLWSRAREFAGWSLRWARDNWPLFLVMAAYIAAYFTYRKFQATPGRGLDVGGQASEIIKTIYRFSVHGLHFELAPLARYAEGTTLLGPLLMSIGFGLCIALAALFVIPATDRDPREAMLRHPVSLAVIAFFVFCPNILFGFVEGYRQWAAEDPHYVGNYLSSFALAILITNGIIALAGGAKARQERLLFFLLVYVLASSATDNMLKWSTLANINRQDATLWTRAITDLKPQMGSQAGETIHVCAKDSPEKVSGDDAFWSYQLSRELERKIVYRSKRLASAPCDITVDFNRYRHPGR